MTRVSHTLLREPIQPDPKVVLIGGVGIREEERGWGQRRRGEGLGSGRRGTGLGVKGVGARFR